jgi:hypothetical protein
VDNEYTRMPSTSAITIGGSVSTSVATIEPVAGVVLAVLLMPPVVEGTGAVCAVTDVDVTLA